jgi:hypothetical protein
MKRKAKEISGDQYRGMSQPEQDAWLHSLMEEMEDEGVVKILGPGSYMKIGPAPKVVTS